MVALGLPLLATGVSPTPRVAAAPTPRDDTGHRQAVTIDDFHNFRSYDVTPGGNADPWISVADGGARYSNLFQPPFPSPGFGQLQFSRNHTLLGVAYTPTWTLDASDAVTLTGVLTRRWPK